MTLILLGLRSTQFENNPPLLVWIDRHAVRLVLRGFPCQGGHLENLGEVRLDFRDQTLGWLEMEALGVILAQRFMLQMNDQQQCPRQQ